MEQDMRTIKRYPNRKLYDTEKKKYITLKGIAELIRQGEEIRVIENATGQDLTPITLSQIIFDQEKEQGGIIPRSVLAGLIQTGEHRLSSIQRSFLSSIGFIRQVDEEIKRRIQALIKQGELAETEGANLLEKLLAASKIPLSNTSKADEKMIQDILAERQIPNRAEMNKIIEQLDNLAAKLDELDRDQD
jgi:polyhydroxyalkanoate synthesis repressor PhaR